MVKVSNEGGLIMVRERFKRAFRKEYKKAYKRVERKGWSKLSMAERYAVGNRGLFGRPVRPGGFPK